jgi:hypothetical protein
VKLLRTLLLAAAVLVAGGTAKADIVIDQFSAPTPAVDYLISGLNTNPYVVTTNGIAPGINRTITLTVAPPVGALSMSGHIGGSYNFFSMSLDNASSGSAVIAYSFATPMNFIPNVALGGAVGALQYLSSADTGFAASTPLLFTITTATGTLSFNTTMNVSSAFTPTNVPLSSFTGTGDLTQVTGMSITIQGGQASDVALDAIGITTPPAPTNEVPAPPAAVLALLALPALGLRRRMARKAAMA